MSESGRVCSSCGRNPYAPPFHAENCATPTADCPTVEDEPVFHQLEALTLEEFRILDHLILAAFSQDRLLNPDGTHSEHLKRLNGKMITSQRVTADGKPYPVRFDYLG